MKKNLNLVLTILVTSIVFTGCAKEAEVPSNELNEEEIISESTGETVESETAETLLQVENSTLPDTQTEQDTESQTEEKSETQTEQQNEKNTEEETSKQTQNTNKVTNTDENIVSEKDDSVTVGESDYNKIVYVPNSATNNDTEATKLAKNIINKIITNGMSDFEKAKAIHDYMVINIDYDYDDYLADTIPYDSYNVIGALKNKYAVCAGYAKTFKLLCELSGLECTYVTGKARGYHAWNQVKIDGKWYNVDVTWDDPVNEEKAFDNHYFNNYNYFLVSDEEFTDHAPNGTVNKCNNSLREKAYETGIPWAKDNYVRNTDELKAAVKKAVDANSSEIFLIWDTRWIEHKDMKDEIVKVLYELNVQPTYKFVKLRYSSYKGVEYIRTTYVMSLENGKYDKLALCTTLDELKNQVMANNNQNEAIYIAKKIANETTYKSMIAWAYDEKDTYVNILSKGNVSDSVAFIKVYKEKKSPEVDKAVNVYSMAEVENLIKEFAKDYSGDVKYITYFYEKELVGKEWSEVESYMQGKAKEWDEKYCVEYESIMIINSIGRITFSLKEGFHEHGPYEEVRKASCSKTSLWQQRCSKCNYLIEEMEYETNGVHDAYWEYLSDTSRRIKCHECDYVGGTEVKMGDIWGYYDYEKSEEMFKLINERRLSALHYNMDDWGNLISVETPPQFTYDESLALKARESIIDIINRDFGSGDEYVHERFWIKGYDNVQRACSMLLDNVSGRNVMNEKTYDIIGISCFSYDEDGTGLNNKTMWCVYFGKSTY